MKRLSMSAADAAVGIAAASMDPATSVRNAQIRLSCESPLSPDIGPVSIAGLALAKHFGQLFAERSEVLLPRHTRDFTGKQAVAMAFPADVATKEACHEHHE